MTRVASVTALLLLLCACGGGGSSSDGVTAASTCVAGAPCSPANRCATGVTACASPTAVATCEVTGAQPDGTPCPNGQACVTGECRGTDGTGPSITARAPAPGATNVRSRDPIAVTFDEPLSPTSLTDATVRLATATGQPIEKTLRLSQDGRTLTVVPLAFAVPNRLALSLDGVTDASGNRLASAAWSWDVPAWQQLGEPRATEPLRVLQPQLTTDAAGEPIVGMLNTSSAPGVSLRLDARRGGSWEEMLSLPTRERGYGALTLDSAPDGDVAAAWVLRPSSTALSRELQVVRWDGTVRHGPETLATAGTIAGLQLRYDRRGRAVVAWTSNEGDDPTLLLFISRFDQGWQPLARAPAPVGSGWTLSFDAEDRPQVTWRTEAEVARMVLTEAGLSSPERAGLDQPAYAHATTSSGQTYVAWWDESAAPPSLRVRRVLAGVPQDLPPPLVTMDHRLVQLQLDGDDAPVVTWFVREHACGVRWTPGGWRPLAADVRCDAPAEPGAADPAGLSVAFSRFGFAVACSQHDSVRVSCARHNEYVAPSP